MMKELTTENGANIPCIGLGTFPFQGSEMARVLVSAVRIGYRLIDTADDYRGESGIGIALQELKSEGLCSREDLFIQTKISANAAYEDDPLAGFFFNKHSQFMQRHTIEEVVREKVDNSLLEMKTSYLDSVLIHLPYPGYIEEIWTTLISLREEGKIRHIGVSNFHQRHIESVCKSGVFPEFNQIYLSPIGTKQELVDYNKDKDILVMTYSPLIDLACNRIPLGKIRPIMEKYKKTAAQIVLRWNIERGCIPLPKSKNPLRLQENFDVFDFSLTEDEVKVISSLNYDYQYLPESKICPGI